MHLTDLGFRRGNVFDVRAFQAAWNLGPALSVDGLVGPKTTAAMRVSLQRAADGRPDASEHFWFREFACRCGRRTCEGIRLLRPLLVGLERLREVAYPKGMRVYSGYRCAQHNAAVGGQDNSQHRYGAAADIEAVVSGTIVADLRVFSGIGTNGTSSGTCRHVDVRHAWLNNTTKSSVARPARWTY